MHFIQENSTFISLISFECFSYLDKQFSETGQYLQIQEVSMLKL